MRFWGFKEQNEYVNQRLQGQDRAASEGDIPSKPYPDSNVVALARRVAALEERNRRTDEVAREGLLKLYREAGWLVPKPPEEEATG